MSQSEYNVIGYAKDVASPVSVSDTISGSNPSSGFPPVIPPEHSARTLVLCFDGTGDQFDSDNSNIVEFFTALKKDQEKQLVYYQAGIGTYISPQIATPGAAKISKLVDEAVGWNLQSHVMDGYEFLMQNYKSGDRICIFGFSRGAYTARGLAGMVHKVGLLPACNHQQVPFAYAMYTRVDETGWKQSDAFKKAFSIDVPIEFVGVWDTVNSVGLIPRRLPFTTSNTIVRTFRHAVALDERRAKFKVNLWNRPNTQEAALGVTGQKTKSEIDHARPKAVHGYSSKNANSKLRTMEKEHSEHVVRMTDIEEVWFSGCHCDVGGGSVANGTPYSLARIPLRWMIRECFKAETGIMFLSDHLRVVGLDPTMLYPYVQMRPPPLPVSDAIIQRVPSTPKKGILQHYADADNLVKAYETEEEHELKDAMSPIYDQLSLKWFWWLLELLPVKQHYQSNTDNTWKSYLGFNLGRGRFMPGQTRKVMKIHRSVKMRMDAQHADGEKYVPRASFEKASACGNVEWVD